MLERNELTKHIPRVKYYKSHGKYTSRVRHPRQRNNNRSKTKIEERNNEGKQEGTIESVSEILNLSGHYR